MDRPSYSLQIRQHPLGHPVEIAVKTLALLDEGVEIDPLIHIEPPVGNAPVGLARPRADRPRQAIFELLGVGGEPVGAAAVEPQTAGEAVDAQDLAPGAVAASSGVVRPPRIERQFEPLHFTRVDPLGGVRQSHRHRVVTRQTVRVGVHKGHERLHLRR